MSELRVHLLKEPIVNPLPPGDRTALPAALLGLVVPRIVESALSGVATALKKAGSDETVQLSGTAFENLYVADARQVLQLNPALGCVLAVWYRPHDERTADDEIAKRLKASNLVPREAAIDGVFEAVFGASPDGTACFLDTRHFSIRGFVGDRHRDRRNVVVTVAMSTPSADPEGRTLALGHVDFGTVDKGRSVIPEGQAPGAFPRYRSNLMPWASISAPSKAAYDRDVAAGRAAGRAYMPITVAVTVSETAEGSRFLLMLGELLGGVAKDAAKEISSRVLKEDESDDAATDAEKLYDDELKARVDEAKARQALAVAGETEQAQALLAWELAARRLAWRTRIREAAGLPARSPLDPRAGT